MNVWLKRMAGDYLVDWLGRVSGLTLGRTFCLAGFVSPATTAWSGEQGNRGGMIRHSVVVP